MSDEYLQRRQLIKLGLINPVEKKAQKPIAKKSAKRIEVDKELAKLSKQLLIKHPRCLIRSPVCTVKSQALDHRQKRSPSNITKPENLIPCCRACNLYKEEHPDWSKENGHEISRFKN